MRRSIVVVSAALLVTAAGPHAALGDPGRPTSCSVRGGGQLEAGDTFGGQATTADAVGGFGSGRWTHVSPLGDQLRGDVDLVRCRADGGGPPDPPDGDDQNLVTFGGTGTWNGQVVDWEGYVEDRGEPQTRDYYAVFVMVGGDIVYTNQGGLAAGNIQIIACHAGCTP